MNEADVLAQTIKGITFRYRFVVAGGVIKTIDQANELIKYDIIGEWGSINTKGSSGNGGRDYHAVYQGHPPRLQRTDNSIGLTNPGMDYVEQHASDYIKRCADNGLPSWLNISGNGVQDTLELAKRATALGFSVVTWNGACPNKPGQPILCDIPEAVDELFERAEVEIGNTETLHAWKVSCGMRRPALTHNRTHFRKSEVFTIAITGNTIPNALGYLPDGKTFIETDNGLTQGGMAGPAIHGIALDHTKFMADELPTGKAVFGCGGAVDVESTYDFIRAGASLVQTNSAFRESDEDPDFIRDTNLNLIDKFKGMPS